MADIRYGTLSACRLKLILLKSVDFNEEGGTAKERRLSPKVGSRNLVAISDVDSLFCLKDDQSLADI